MNYMFELKSEITLKKKKKIKIKDSRFLSWAECLQQFF